MTAAVREFERGGLVRARAGIVATLFVLVPAAAAEPPNEDNAEPAAVRSDFFETATVRARPLNQVTASVTVLGRDEIEASQATSAAELLRYVQGLSVIGGGPRGAGATALVRGGDPNFTVVLLDGVPLNDATDPFGGSVNLNSLPTAHLERVEVVRGPLSSFLGSAGLAGVVNLITRRGAGDRPVIATEVAGGDASTRGGAASVSAAAERHDYFVGATWQEEEGRVADDAFDQFNLQGNLRSDIGGRASLGLSGRYSSWTARDYPEGSGGPVLGSGATRASEHDELSVGLTWQSAGQAGDGGGHQVHASLQHHGLARTSPGVGFEVPPSVEDTDFTSLRLAWSLPVIETERTRLNVGAEVESEEGRNRGFLDLPPEFGGRTDAAYSIRREALGGYLEWVVDRGPLLFELGARWDIPEGFDQELSPRAGVAWRAASGATRVTASVGRGFKLPSFFALASPSALGGNPELKPETSLGVDVGLERRVEAAGLTASVTGFFNRFEDLIDFDFTRFMNINRDSVQSHGLELALNWIPADDLELRVSMTGQRVEDRQTGQPLRHRPERSGSARLIWRGTERVRGQVDGRWLSEMQDEQIPVPTRRTVPGTPLYGAGVQVDVGRGLELGVRIDNLTDRDYETFIGFPGPGRAYRVTLRHTTGGT